MEKYSMKLSQRLIHVADFLPKGAYFADIGSDHAYLPCYICLRDRAAKAIAGEVNQGPYESAKKNVRKYGLENRVDVRLGDGLDVLQHEEVNQLVIAGMGGALIASILEKGKEKLTNVKQIIAQPNIDARQVRLWFKNNNFILTDERILDEKGHIYEILVADRDSNSPYTAEITERQLLFGPYLLENKNDVFYKKWYDEEEKLTAIIKQVKRATDPDEEKIRQFTKERAWIKEELATNEDSN